MSYGKFKSVEEVATKFDIKVADRTAFLEERNLEILEAFLSMVAKNLMDDTNYVTEFAVCDAIIRPIIGIVASSLLGTPICYGIVTTGAIWQFGKLEKSVFVIDSRYLSATTELQRVFNTINWIFHNIS